MIDWSVRIWLIPLASVGLGWEDWTPPHEAQDPIATTAAAFGAMSLTISSAVFPAILQ